MSVTDDTPICIPSDDDDSDVEIVKEEKVDLDDGDVIFVSQTSPKISTIEDESPSGQSGIQVGTSMQGDKLDIKSQTIIPCHRSVSISTDLEMTLSLQDHTEVGAPLDLSSRKLEGESDDSLDDSSCESTCTSFSSSDESVLNIPNDQVDIKTESNLPCLKPTNQFNVNHILGLQTADNSKSKAVTPCSPFQSSFDEYISNSLDMTYDMKPIFPTMCKIEPQDKNSCKSQYACKTNSAGTSLQSSSDTSGSVTYTMLSQTCSTQVDSTTNSILGTHAQGTGTSGITTSGTHVSGTDTLGTQTSPSTDSMVQCSAPKKKKENTSDSDDIWASLKKDLDFLNNLNDEILAVNTSVTTTKCLSNSESNGANNNSKSSLDMSNFQSTNDSKTSTNQSSVLTGSVLPQSQTTGRSATVIKSVSSFPSFLTNANSSSCNTMNTSTGSSDSKQLPPKKQLRCFPLGKNVTCTNNKNTAPAMETGNKWGSEKCSSCMISLLGLKSSRCLQGHVTCGGCLEERVKLVLTGKSKESLRCVQTNCDSYYPMSELKHSLPSMVVEILEDKLDNDYIEYISNMIMKNACPSAVTGPGGSQEKQTESHQSLEDLNTVPTSSKQEENSAGFCTDTSDSKQQIPEDWPTTWCKMDNRAGFILVQLKPESPEYIDVAVKFHSTLTFPAADILKISRVQNPILWKYHCVKRLEMIHDNDGLAVEQRHLYHGTTSSVVDAICRKGFDWRVCGKHGTVYGQGSYFAADASYSHQYTDKGNNKVFYRLGSLSRRTHAGRSLIRPRPSQLLIPPPAHAGANLSNLIMSPTPAGFLSMQFGPSITSQGQGQNQGQGQSQNLVTNIQSVSSSNINNQGISNNNLNNLCGSNSNMSVTSNLPSQTNNNLIGSLSQTNNNLIGSYQVQFNPAVPPPAPATVSHAVNSAIPSSGFLFGAPRKRLIGASNLSSQEEPQDPQPVHKMFMSKVLVGKYTGGHAGLRKPPPLFPDLDPYGKCYDSCVDNILNPKIFVIFDSTQAYPDYLIEYHFTG